MLITLTRSALVRPLLVLVSIAIVSTAAMSQGARSAILIGSFDLAAIQSALKRFGITAPPNLDDEGYVLTVNGNEVLVAGKTAAGTFYGLQTLKQLVRGDGTAVFIPAVEIVDWPAMRWRGVSDDISRGPVPTVNYIKRQLRDLRGVQTHLNGSQAGAQVP